MFKVLQISCSLSGPDFWGLAYPACSEAKQSPVKIIHEEAKPDDSLTSFRFHGYDDVRTLNNLTVWNDGYTGKQTNEYTITWIQEKEGKIHLLQKTFL